MLQTVHSRCAGLDLHKKFIVACARYFEAQTGEVLEEVAQFDTMPDGLVALCEWLMERGVTHVAMESTGVLWRPVYEQLEEHFAEVAVVNAQHLKQVPGRKTDVLDSQWLAQLYQMGLLRRSFVPPRAVREVRELTRDRARLVADRAQVTNRIGKELESAGVKLGSVCSDIMGASGRAILAALVEGHSSAEAMAELALGKLRGKRAELVRALSVGLSAARRFTVQRLLVQWGQLSEHIATVSQEIARRLAVHEDVLRRLATIPGVSRQTAEVIVSEVGMDMSWFETAGHLCSWAGVCPGQRESGGKRGSGRCRRGNRWLRSALVQSAWAATRQAGSWLRARYYALKQRRGGKRAAVALARSILSAVWQVLSGDEVVYAEPQSSPRPVVSPVAQMESLVRRLRDIGYVADPQPILEAELVPLAGDLTAVF